jgi:hypothetical protein
MHTRHANPKTESPVKSIAYDPKSRTMQVQFGNAHYTYPDVTQEDFDSFKSADSWGGHMQREIKPNYTGTKLEDHEVWK